MLGVEDAIHLGAAGFEPFGHFTFGDMLSLHRGGKLAGCFVDRQGDSFV